MTHDDLITAVVTLGALYEIGAVDAYGDYLTIKEFDVAKKAFEWAEEDRRGEPMSAHPFDGHCVDCQ
jgi:hypothetical protein